jgi:hypothetical protein
VVRFIKHVLLNFLSFFKTYLSGMEQKSSLIAPIFTAKRFHCIRSQGRIGRTSIKFSNTEKRYVRTISTSSGPEPVLIYTNPDEDKGLIVKQNKNKSGVYR